MKRRILRVRWVKSRGLWVVSGWLSAEYERKADAVARATAEAHLAATLKDWKVQVVSHRKDGVIQWERTYPRSSDPRRSRG
ncbi:MAG: hypothetical protein RL375_252 [Pseudomonadota bacterium]